MPFEFSFTKQFADKTINSMIQMETKLIEYFTCYDCTTQIHHFYRQEDSYTETLHLTIYKQIRSVS